MLRLFPVLLLGLMLAEIAGFVIVGQRIGAAMVLLLVILAAVAGTWLIRREGLNALGTLRVALEGRPGARRGPRLAVILAGLLLILPGFLSDAAALLLLLPPVRRAIAAPLMQPLAGSGHARPGYRGSAPVIEGEAVEIVEPQPSRWPSGGADQSASPGASPWRR